MLLSKPQSTEVSVSGSFLQNAHKLQTCGCKMKENCCDVHKASSVALCKCIVQTANRGSAMFFHISIACTFHWDKVERLFSNALGLFALTRFARLSVAVSDGFHQSRMHPVLPKYSLRSASYCPFEGRNSLGGGLYMRLPCFPYFGEENEKPV